MQWFYVLRFTQLDNLCSGVVVAIYNKPLFLWFNIFSLRSSSWPWIERFNQASHAADITRQRRMLKFQSLDFTILEFGVTWFMII